MISTPPNPPELGVVSPVVAIFFHTTPLTTTDLHVPSKYRPGNMRTNSHTKTPLITLLEARSLLQEQLGTPITDATIRNWHSIGVRGFILPTFLVGGRRFTTERAITGFLRELNDGAGLDSVLATPAGPP